MITRALTPVLTLALTGTALAQEAAYKAHAVREGSGNASRINATHAKIGWDATVDSVFGSAAPIPSTVVIAKPAKRDENELFLARHCVLLLMPASGRDRR